MAGQKTRNKLTDYWKGHDDVNKESEFAILANIIHQKWAGVGVKEHKKIKGVKTLNLPGHTTRYSIDAVHFVHRIYVLNHPCSEVSSFRLMLETLSRKEPLPTTEN